MISEKIELYLTSSRGTKCSARWISKQISEKQTSVSHQLRRMVKAGLIKCQMKIEYDTEFNRYFKRNVRCQRRRNYYWVD